MRYSRLAFLAALCAVFLLGAPVEAQTTTGLQLDVAYTRWLRQFALSYTYEAAITVQASPPTNGTVRAVFTNGSATSVSVLAQSPTPSANGTSLVGYAAPVSTMFTQLLAGVADASASTAGGPVYDATFGYPAVYSATSGSLVEFTVAISSLTVTAVDTTRQAAETSNDQALALWERDGYASYHFVTQQSCGLGCADPDPQRPGYSKPVIVNVHSGSVVSALDERTREQLPSFAQYSPIPLQLGDIARYILTARSLSSFGVTYDPRLGYPELFRRTEGDSAFDSTVTVVITEVGPREVEASDGGTPRWVFAIVILVVIAVIAGLVAFFCCRKKSSDGAPTDRTMADEERTSGVAPGAQAPQRGGAAVDYGGEEMRSKPPQQRAGNGGSVQYEV